VNRKLYLLVCSVLLLVTTCLYVLLTPPRTGCLGLVTLSVVGYSTNALGQLTATVAITNEGPHMISFEVGTQVLQGAQWVDSTNNISTPAAVTLPKKQVVVSVFTPAPHAVWRVCAAGSKFYITPRILTSRATLSYSFAQARWIVDTRILKRSDVEHFYSQEYGR
jgi:hypothetical protein